MLSPGGRGRSFTANLTSAFLCKKPCIFARFPNFSGYNPLSGKDLHRLDRITTFTRAGKKLLAT